MSFERYLGLDVGNKRVGVALSDPLMITAQPYQTINREPEKKCIENIGNICKDNNVIAIIFGLPKNMNGTLGPQAQNVKEFADKIKDQLQIDIYFEDERLTSRQAERSLLEQGKKASRNKPLIDVASAAIILQQFLDKRRI